MASEKIQIGSILKKFNLDKTTKISNSSYQHRKIYVKDVDPTKNRKKCNLCAKGNRKYSQTHFMCNVCDVPLCAHPCGKQNNNESCFLLWHIAEILMEVHKQAHESTIRAKSSADDILGDDIDDSSTYSVDDRDFQQVPGLPRIEENIDSQQVPELPSIEGDIDSQLVLEFPRIQGDMASQQAPELHRIDGV